jgi:ATP-dependent DNA ligase
MKLRFGEKPHEIYPDQLPNLDAKKQHIATSKLDGWRCQVVKDSTGKYVTAKNTQGIAFGHKNWGVGSKQDLFFISRRGLDDGGPTKFPVCQDLINEVDELDLPDQTVLDSEWMKRRTIGEIDESVFIFDVLWLDDIWNGKIPYCQRLETIDSIINKDGSRVRLPQVAHENYTDFYEAHKKIPYTEGMVLRHKFSTVSGNRMHCIKSNALLKMKWRSGADGREVYSE